MSSVAAEPVELVVKRELIGVGLSPVSGISLSALLTPNFDISDDRSEDPVAETRPLDMVLIVVLVEVLNFTITSPGR